MDYHPYFKEFPILEYNKCSSIIIDNHNNLHKGCTWSHLVETPWYEQRVKIFEAGFWPY